MTHRAGARSLNVWHNGRRASPRDNAGRWPRTAVAVRPGSKATRQLPESIARMASKAVMASFS